MPTPVDEAVIRYGNEREARAHRLLGDGGPGAGEVKLTKVHDVVGEGTGIHGEVVDREARAQLLPHASRWTSRGACARRAAAARTSGARALREGPCEHMIALRLAYARQRARGGGAAARRPRAASSSARRRARTCAARPRAQEQVYRVSLDGRRCVAVEWGPRPGEPRHQRLWFDTDAEARDGLLRAPGEAGRRGLHRRGLGLSVVNHASVVTEAAERRV